MSDVKLIETYKEFLENYSPEQLKYKPEPGVWSLGQMYDHLLVCAHEYLDHAKACAAAPANQKRGKTEFGERLFTSGGFPPIKIRLPDEMNAPPDNSKSIEDLMFELDGLKDRMKKVEVSVQEINPANKMEHGGFGWLNAQEWLALVEMHFRHHLRQKDELDQKLI